MNHFTIIEEFPDYGVDEFGDIFSFKNEIHIRPATNQAGVKMVILWKDHKKYCRSVAVIVAKTFIDPGFKRANTIIHLDGNRSNVNVDNLAWRPRPFAITYHQQFKEQPYPNRINRHLMIHETGEVFPDSWTLAKTYGLLERAVVLSALNIKGGDWNYTVFPQKFHILFI
jgi:hypothetical protein